MYYNKDFILETLISWINSVTMKTINKRYEYAGNDLGTNLGEPSKSYIEGQLFCNDEYSTVYISLILDPNIIWGYKHNAFDVYSDLIEYFNYIRPSTLLSGINIEMLYSQQSSLKICEAKSKCRTEETNIKL